ncbi:hypothetical protein JOB18_040638 [Solea senegalensis]|uniref:Uncharacterized protein n=1 Tax=Solea senegalensis TaxID=28829 RepID=A0AAV6PP96_SOLSE|nr:hypothetical protein JOB18_040638 [Solea senegalensis]
MAACSSSSDGKECLTSPVDLNSSDSFCDLSDSFLVARDDFKKTPNSPTSALCAGSERLSKLASSDVDLDKEPQCLFFRDGILMRKWRSYNVPDECNSLEQVVVPSGTYSDIAIRIVMAARAVAAAPSGISEYESFGSFVVPRRSAGKSYNREILLNIKAADTGSHGHRSADIRATHTGSHRHRSTDARATDTGSVRHRSADIRDTDTGRHGHRSAEPGSRTFPCVHLNS